MRRVACTLWLLATLACEEAVTRAPLTPEQLLDPQNCKDCHPKHYAEWSGSMHAYAMADPVFLAMNKRGQEETGGELGDFCVKCHAPLAVRRGVIKDFADLTEVPEHLQGVTCYFCHNVKSVETPHNNANLTLAWDDRMRGALGKPVEPFAHRVEYSKHLDPRLPESSLMCGTCHDIVMPNGLHLERTLHEYQNSVFVRPGEGFQSCSSCHTQSKGKQEPAANYEVQQVPARWVHEHTWGGVDVALTEFPNAEAQRVLVERCMFGERTQFSLTAQRRQTLPVEPFEIYVFLEATNVGHSVPSGASQDRRLWLELHAYDEMGREVFASGAIGDHELEREPQLFLFRDQLLDEHGEETHMFWRAAKLGDRLSLPTADPANPSGAHGADHSYLTPWDKGKPVRVEFRLRMRPMGRDVLQDLVDSGHLDPEIMERMPTFTVAEWEGELNKADYYDLQPIGDGTCEEYEQLMYPDD